MASNKGRVTVGMRTKSSDAGNPLPDSKLLGGDPNADAIAHLRGLHVGGEPVESLPQEVWHLLTRQHTDEGIAEANAGKLKPGDVGYGLRVGDGPLEKSIEERRDFRRDQMETWEAPDPMKALADAHVGPGFRPRFLSQDRLNKEGNLGRGFEVVTDAKGDPVKLGSLVLARMPEDLADKRNDAVRSKGKAQLREVYREAQSNGVSLVERRRGESVRDADPDESSESYFSGEDFA